MAKKYKCLYCEKRLIRKDLINHIDKQHEELIPQGYTAARVVYNQVNKVDQGKCRVCGNPTTWNEKSGRYDVLCGNPKCKEHMREEYKKNMLRVRGTYNILNDPEQQKRMLANRSISGTYKFSDGGALTYTGSYEKKCLEFMDVVMQIPSKDILSPGPTLEYMYNGEKHFYITDFYYIPYNLIIEVKDGGDNLNTKESSSMRASREKTIEKEHLITDRGEYNYIRLTNNNFAQLIEVFMEIKQKLLEGDDSKTYKINESGMILESYFNESKEDVAAILLGKRKLINDKYTVLYHGTDVGNLKTIMPYSYNAGMHNDKPKMSSYWFNDPVYAATFATMTLLNSYDETPYGELIDNDMMLLVNNKYKNKVLSIIKDNKAYIYEKFINTKYLGYGHSGTFPEYTLDIPVAPDHCYEIYSDIMINRIKFVSMDYIKSISQMYKAGKMSFGATRFQQIINRIFYYDNNKKRNVKIKKAKINNRPDMPIAFAESKEDDIKNILRLSMDPPKYAIRYDQEAANNYRLTGDAKYASDIYTYQYMQNRHSCLYNISFDIPSFVDLEKIERKVDTYGKREYYKVLNNMTKANNNGESFYVSIPFKYYELYSDIQNVKYLVYNSVTGVLNRNKAKVYQHNFSVDNRKYSVLIITLDNHVKNIYLLGYERNVIFSPGHTVYTLIK